MEKLRSAVFISSGLGNAITLVPLVNALKSVGHHVTGIFTSPFKCQDLFEHSEIFDEKIVVRSKTRLVMKSISKRNSFDYLFADRFSCTRKHFLLARSISNKTYIQYDIGDSPETFIYKKPDPYAHSVSNNLKLAEDIIGVGITPSLKFEERKLKNDGPIVFQPGGGNSKTPWKVWPLENWIEILQDIDHPITVIGDKTEFELANKLKQLKLKNLNIQIGQTNIQKMVHLVSEASLFIGHDSGPMHVAAALGVPTFTIWGGSDVQLFGYEKLYPETNKCIKLSVSCNPCDSWLNRNTSRVVSPINCPDFKCIKEIQSAYVAEELIKFVDRIDAKIAFK